VILIQKRSFERAAQRVKSLSERPDDATLLRLYGLYKQARQGDASGRLPITEGMIAVAKYKAWQKCAGLPEGEAMSRYVELVEACLQGESRATDSSNGSAESPIDDFSSAVGRIDDWSGRTVLISGASRGIGRAIALRFAEAGANLVLLGRTMQPGVVPGTLPETAAEVEAKGGEALCAPTDVRDEKAIAQAVEAAMERFGGIDMVVCNAGALFIAPFGETPMKRFDLMHQVNLRATYALCQAALPALRASDGGRILVLSPPISLESKWLDGSLAYTLSKYGMSMLVLGLSGELATDGIAVNAMWPATTIDTAAVRSNEALGGEQMARRSRKPSICADAAFEIASRPTDHSGFFHTDEAVLRQTGVTDLECYAVEPGMSLQPDFYL